MIRFAPLALVAIAAPAQAQDAGPVLTDPAAFAVAAREGQKYPLFAAEVARTKASVATAMRAGVIVPVPKDPGGGYTHEQHKRNYAALYNAGMLYRLTGERKYADFARAMLLEYAKLLPTLGEHPAKANEAAGRLFWQSLNDAVWLVNAVQGYDVIRDTLSPTDRATIDEKVFRTEANFLAVADAKTFDRIHNHATWSCAAVGMTGYVLRDRNLIDVALKGRAKDGKTGFLAQVGQLFSPDGYYTEGPYYQRYAIQPFAVFAQAIAANDPGVGIFRRRDGVLLKAIRATIQLTYDGMFFPLNDALNDKTLKTEELYQAVAVGYAQTQDPAFLSIAQWQARVIATPLGAALARDVAAGKAKPFPYTSGLFRDGPAGDEGGIAVMRADSDPRGAVAVAKNTGMGMGHGHFDKLSWIFFDKGQAVVTDYGAARFLNVESKDGGRYLPENESWAKQTVAHNTLVVDETSDFAGKWQAGQETPPQQLFWSGDGATKVSTAEQAGAWPGVTFRRTLVMLPVAGSPSPLMIDLVRATGGKAATYDLPLHYNGAITELSFPVASNAAVRPVLGKANGYQHIWVDATATPGPDAAVTWLLDGRFYTYRMLLPAGAQVILGESGANDPRFNLRREPLLIARAAGAKDATFVNVLEPHGAYDGSAETVVGSHSRIKALTRTRTADAELVTIVLEKGSTVTLAIADGVDAKARHSATVNGKARVWSGHFARFDEEARP